MILHDAVSVEATVAGNPYYATAIDCPEYHEAVALRQAAREQLATLESADLPNDPQRPDEIAAWLADIAANHDARRIREAKFNALKSLINRCDSQIESAMTTDRDRLLRSLHADMDALMADVSAVVRRLNGASTPSEAIKGGVSDAWTELGVLREAYDQIRAAQMFVIAGAYNVLSDAQSKYLDDPLASNIAIANLDDVFPAWRIPNRTHTRMSNDPPPDPRPWPLDGIEQLVWLATSGAQVWVPTLKQLGTVARERSRRAANPVKRGRPDRPPTPHDFGDSIAQRSTPIPSTPLRSNMIRR
ncbi:hypothetical protein SAMN04488581_0400 [Mycolicibacterium neoaurum]|uniref:hypothetical protein n=1 Tax=Mycolicibacterium neoaurum TaxID=1795 RepID=UPI0005611866|nr:hypothetical protein [Mycolicibacterium neoaurum]SDC25840.1 hypothetical protein SAMN04488581_0400 [Mycolicibacterium neoaurum]